MCGGRAAQISQARSIAAVTLRLQFRQWHALAPKCESNKTKAFERCDYRSSASASVSAIIKIADLQERGIIHVRNKACNRSIYIPLKSTYITSWKTGEGEVEWESLKSAFRVERKQMLRKNTRSLLGNFFKYIRKKQAVVAASGRLICLREMFDDSFKRVRENQVEVAKVARYFWQ